MKRLNKNEIRAKHLQNLMTLFGTSLSETKSVFGSLKGIEM